MMPRKKRITILISSIVLVILIISLTLVLLYKNTDMFKSNKTLLIKYMMKNTENIENVVSALENNQYKEKLNENKYTNNTTIKINHTENIGTSLENTNSTINQLYLSLEGKVDKNSNYNYQDIKILNNDNEPQMFIEYIKDNNTYGVRFSDLFNQYILVDNENLKKLYENLGKEQEILTNIPDSIDLENDIFGKLSFTKEEKDIIEEKYRNILEREFENQNITKQKNQIITVNEQKLVTNAYTIKLTKEKFNNIFLKILEEVKQDEVILSKFEDIGNILNSYYAIIGENNQTNLKDKFIEDIEKKIDEINRTNIGQDETSIIVYENNRNTIRTTIKYTDYEVNIDSIGSQGNLYVQFKIEKAKQKQTNTITLMEQNNNLNIDIEQNNEDNIKKINFARDTQMNEIDNFQKIEMKYEDGTDRVEANIEQNVKLVNELNNLPKVQENNSVKLNDLDKERLQPLMQRIKTSLNEKTNETFTSKGTEDFNKILNVLGIKKEGQTIESTGITETEKNRFNSQFEMLQGNEITAENIIRAIDAAKNNINGIEIVSNTKLKIKIDRNNSNEEVTSQLVDFIEQDKGRKYNVGVEYNQNGLVQYIVLEIVTVQD